MAKSLTRFGESSVAEQRQKVIAFYNKHGEGPCKEAFYIDRKLIYVWRQRLKKSQGKLVGLVPQSTQPKRCRQMQTHPKVVSFIRQTREQHPRLGKEKIKPLLDEYCLLYGYPTIAVPTIGKVIKRHKLFSPKRGRIYHNPSSKWATNQERTKRLRNKHPVKHKTFGHIQSDAVEIITDGVRDYFISGIDVAMKFAFTAHYKRLTASNNKDFYHKFTQVYPGRIKSWQTDNGSENLSVFDEQLARDKIPHYFTYPRCPKVNGTIERYNRTIQEEFIQNHCDVLDDTVEFNRRLVDYLVFYNTKRVHKSLGNITPIDYLLLKGGMSKMSVAHTEN